MTRGYRPATTADLRRLLDDGGLPPSAEVVVAPGDDEESEYAALLTAADASAQRGDGDGRRVVVVGELPDPDGPWRVRDVVAVHADPSPYVDPDDDLAWYAPQEIEAFLE